VVIGRLARAYDLDAAEEAFERAHRLAEINRLTVWRSRALHELGTIDMFREFSPRRLLQARDLALESGALATAAAVDGELAAVYALRFELDDCLAAAQRALEAARRFRLPGVETMGLFFTAEVQAMRQDRLGVERTLAELPKISGEEAYFGLVCAHDRATLWLLEENRPRALQELEAAMDFGRQLSAAGPSPAFGMWALLRTLTDNGAAQARDWVRGLWVMAQPANRGLLQYADAVDWGRQGLPEQAAQSMAEGDRILAGGPFYRHYGGRLAAEAAIRDGWGEPVAWLRETEAFCEQHGYVAVSSACRSLLRKCGAARGRVHATVPQPFNRQGVTEREMEVLAVLADGLSNKAIGTRLYLSPKTVEKHVASLMDKLEVRTRAQLATIAAAHIPSSARNAL